ncbi:nitroreductase family protein [Telmatospirillum siberiense]|uniref:Nitroreductase n=1 Tax=Telmatospirillum siberiense TaxID=382514 RepID=A0A2N3PUG4_9PROT|nr:nitroreductase family protein [Telmatospirillum siberiense]PKU24049.1 nitroreductase [Telmatospirillum siberiense]
MKTQDDLRPWAAFQAANRFRRAIRKFDSTPIPEEDVCALLAEAAFAPSSGNLQPYELHWIRDPSLKANVASACNGQKAAASATDLIVVAASPSLGKRTAMAQLAHVETSAALEPNSKAYYRKQIGKFQKILGIGSSALWSPLLFLAALIRPSLSLLPVGHIGSRHWAARNAIFAAQTLMLGAAAKGIDSCPMEGFSASKVAKILGLSRGTVIPIVIALGYRAQDARIEERWRRPITDVVVLH